MTQKHTRPLIGHFLEPLLMEGEKWLEVLALAKESPFLVPLFVTAVTKEIVERDYALVSKGCDAIYPVWIFKAPVRNVIMQPMPERHWLGIYVPESRLVTGAELYWKLKDWFKSQSSALLDSMRLSLNGCLPEDCEGQLLEEADFRRLIATKPLTATPSKTDYGFLQEIADRIKRFLDGEEGTGGNYSALKKRYPKKVASKEVAEKTHDRFVFPSGRAIEYDIEYRSNRKRSAIFVIEGKVVLRHPKRKALRATESTFILQNEAWIFRTIKAHQCRVEKPKQFVLRDGGRILYRGERARLTFGAESESVSRLPSGGVYVYDIALPIPRDAGEKEAREALCAFLRRKAKSVIEASFDRVSPLAKVLPKNPWRLSSAWRQWGNCTSRGQISYAWRLVCMSDALIDYVVAHELAHLVEFNHAPRFWAEVGRMVPDWAERRRQLKAVEMILPPVRE